jgi:hypothetical protein
VSQTSISPTPSEDTELPMFMSIPYVKILFEKLKKLMPVYNIRLVGRASQPLKNSLFSRTKNPVPLSQHPI